MSSYQPNIPTGTVNLDVDYQNLRGNFQAIDSVYQIDHVAMTDSTPLKGFHKVTHLVDSGVDPATVSGSGILYNKDVNDGITTDFSLYYKTSLGTIIQLTRNILPKASTNGYSFLPGGLIIQWGFVSRTGGVSLTLPVNLTTDNIAFPNNFFTIYTTPTFTGSAPNVNGTASARIINLSTFSVNTFFSNSSQFNGFNWLAIGN